MFERIYFSLLKLYFNDRKNKCNYKLLSQAVCVKKVKHVIFLQGDLVYQLKGQGASELELSKAVSELKARKKILEAKVRVSQLLVNFFPPDFLSEYLLQLKKNNGAINHVLSLEGTGLAA